MVQGWCGVWYEVGQQNKVTKYLQYKMYEANESTIDGASWVYDESGIEALTEGLRDPRSTLLGVPLPTKFVA